MLQEVERGRYKIRVGQIWHVPRLRGSTVLELDLDNTQGISRSAIRRRLSKAGMSVLRIRTKRSPSGRGYHVLVYVRGTFTPLARIALQAILESDPDREAQNFRRAMLADPKWQGKWQALYE